MNKSYLKAIGIGLLSVLSVNSFAGGNITAGFTSTTVCEGGNTILTSTSTTVSGNINSWSWDLDGNGVFGDAFGPSIVFVFPDSGTFSVGLEVTTDLNETASFYDDVFVSPFPEAAFMADDVCKGQATAFMDMSTITSGSIVSWEWDFDNDGFFDDATGQSASHDFQNPNTYSVGLQVTSDMGCASQVYLNTITVNPIPNGTFTAQNECIGDQTHFSANGTVLTGTVTGYSWDMNADNVFGDETGSEADYQFLSPGTHPVTLRVTSDEGCTSETTNYITIIPKPIIIFNVSGECENASVQFLNQSSSQVGTITYLWDFGDGQTSTDVNPSHVYTSDGTFTVTLTGTTQVGSSNCSNSATQTVTILPAPNAAFTYNEVCAGFVTDFDNNSTDGGSVIDNYLWTFGDNDASVAENPSHQYAYAGVYPVSLVVTSTDGCRDTATANVNVWALPTPHIVASGALSFCSGDSVELSVTLAGGQGAVWSNGATTASTTVTTGGSYIVNVYDQNGCQQKDTMEVIVWDLPVLTVSNDTTVSLGYDVPLWASGANYYTWSPATYLNGTTGPNVVSVSPLETITYTVTGEDNNGCVNTADVTVTVNKDYTLETVNLFTPNGDGYNDVWKIKNANLYPDCQVNVYNRWGVEVFSAKDYQNTWDGTSDSGEKLPEATYYYTIKCDGAPDKQYDGAINILRNNN